MKGCVLSVLAAFRSVNGMSSVCSSERGSCCLMLCRRFPGTFEALNGCWCESTRFAARIPATKSLSLSLQSLAFVAVVNAYRYIYIFQGGMERRERKK